jgi:hypothetical protein
VGTLVVRQIGTPSEVVEGIGDAERKLRWLAPEEFRSDRWGGSFCTRLA